MKELVTAVSTRTYGYGRELPLKDGRVGIVQNRWKHGKDAQGRARWCYTLAVKR